MRTNKSSCSACKIYPTHPLRDLHKPEQYRDQLAQFSMIVDTSADYSRKTPTRVIANSSRLSSLLVLISVPPTSTRGGNFISVITEGDGSCFGSGILVYADEPNRVLDEETPASNPLAIRIKFEKWVMEQERVRNPISSRIR